MSGGYGSGGYPGQGYGAPDYEEDPDRTRPRRRDGGQQQWDGSVWQGDQGDQRDQGYDGYDGPPGYGGQEFGPPGHGGQGYHGPGYGDQTYGDPGYDPRGYGPPDGGQYYQGTGPQPGQYGTGGTPQFDPQYGPDPRRPQGGQSGQGGQCGQGGYGQGGYEDWDQDQGDGSSFLPGFGGRDAEQGGRYDYDDRRGRGRSRRDGRGPATGPADPGPGPGDWGPGGPGDWGPGGPGGPGDRGTDPRGMGNDPRDWDDRDRRPRKKATRWLPRILVLTVVAVIVIGGLVGGLDIYHKYQDRYHPADYAGQGTGDVVFQVGNGDTAFSIAPRLYQMGVIASERAFTNAAEDATTTTSSGGSSGGLEAGYYNLHLHMQASLAYAALINPKNAIQTAVTIPEGERVSQVLSILAAKTKIPLSQFEKAAKETSKLGLPSYAGTTAKLPSTVPYGQIEGYLFPATYTITPHETALQILQAMVQRFNVEAVQLNLTAAAQSAHLTPTQLIIEASMVQAEAGVNSDMPKMASVINNRKSAGMPDGFDSVVFYGLGKYGINIPNGLNPATAGQYDNTQKPGLPPTPIDNPGAVAIQAVLQPAKTDYLYFLTVATGKPTEFSNNCHDLPGTC
jgi:uncharacterized YceG family protein